MQAKHSISDKGYEFHMNENIKVKQKGATTYGQELYLEWN